MKRVNVAVLQRLQAHAAASPVSTPPTADVAIDQDEAVTPDECRNLAQQTSPDI